VREGQGGRGGGGGGGDWEGVNGRVNEELLEPY